MTITVDRWRKGKPGEYIGRTMPRQGLRGSPLGNPYRLGERDDRAAVIEMYRQWLTEQLSWSAAPATVEIERLTDLARDGDLVLLCWCAPQSCHGDVIKAIIEERLEAQP
jgi:hypothetical protein